MERVLRAVLLIVGGLYTLLAVGLFFQMPWATALWPWPDSRLSYIFLASIAAAIAAPNIWIGLTGELSVIMGGAINLVIAFGGMAFAFFQFAGASDNPALIPYAIGAGVGALMIAGIALVTYRTPARDQRPMPTLVRLSFGAFAVILILVSIALISRAPVVFPWPLRPESSVMYGWIFLGASAYFIYGALRPSWRNTCGQLLGFLAYDLILIGPYVAHFATVRPEHLNSLILYVIVLVYSGALAVYYLFIHPATRLWPPAPVAQSSDLAPQSPTLG
jgi:hypothetical protein